jgi:poly(3-hydroxyalkanoate) synthetase
MAYLARIYLQNKIINNDLSIKESLVFLNKYQCKVFDGYAIPDFPGKRIQTLFKSLNVLIPYKILM